MKRYVQPFLFLTIATAANAQCTFPIYQQFQVEDCVSGLTYLEIYQADWPGVPLFYALDNGGLQSFPANWSLVGGHHRLNTPVAAGYHEVYLEGFVSPNGNTEICPVTLTYFTYLSITPGDCGVNIRLRAALDGALPSGTLMTDNLRAAGLVPLTQPYSTLGYTFVGSPTNITVPAALLAVTGANAVVDWVVVELRSASTPTVIIYSKPALLQRDGDVIDTDGDTYVNCPIATGNYYVAIRHRNHLGVMSAQPNSRQLNPDLGKTDFTATIATGWNNATYGTNARVLKGTVQCLWGGDVTGNGEVKYVGDGNDRDPILTAIGGSTPTNVVTNVYSPMDVNMDGQIKYVGNGNDRDPILTTVGGTVPTATRAQQLP